MEINVITENTIEVFKQLNWYYILSFSLMIYLSEKIGIFKRLYDKGKKGIAVLIIGMMYAYIYLRIFGITEREQLFVSFLFSVTMHGTLYKTIKKIIDEKENEQK